MREARDAELSAPAAPAAVDPGEHPRRQLAAADANGVRYLKIPVKLVA